MIIGTLDVTHPKSKTGANHNKLPKADRCNWLMGGHLADHNKLSSADHCNWLIDGHLADHNKLPLAIYWNRPKDKYSASLQRFRQLQQIAFGRSLELAHR